MSALTVYLDGIGVQGPGLAGWSATQAILAGRTPYVAEALKLPTIEALPPAERRRVGLLVKLAFATGFEAMQQAGITADAAAQLATVFCSSSADCDNCHNILDALSTPERAVSPTRFCNSVHNAPSGYWSIATGAQVATTSLCAYDSSFTAGLLDAATQVHCNNAPCLLLAYDTPYPEPLAACRPVPHPLALALLLRPQRTAASLAALTITLDSGAATTLTDPALDALRSGIPAARALPLLQALACGGKDTSVWLDYLDPHRVQVDVTHVA
jgi:hypothetical protein